MPYAAPWCVVWLIGRKILKMTKFVWMCVFGSGAHLKVCGHALLVAPLVPGPGRPFDGEFRPLGCRGRSVARPPVDGGSVSPTRSTSYLSRSSSWQTFNGLNPCDSGLHKCFQRFSKRLQGVGQYWASRQMLSAAARGNCGKLEKWTAGKSTAWKLPDPAQTPQPSSW